MCNHRSMYVCPECNRYLDEYPTDREFLLCTVCGQVWEIDQLNIEEVEACA